MTTQPIKLRGPGVYQGQLLTSRHWAYGAKFAKATAKITDDLDELLAFYDYPALRHEAPHDRAGVRDHHRWAVAAA